MSWVVSERDSRAWEIIVWALKLLFVEALKGFVIDAAHSVAKRKHQDAVAVRFCFQDGSITDAAGAQKQSSTCNFRIFLISSEASQQGHGYGVLEREAI